MIDENSEPLQPIKFDLLEILLRWRKTIYLWTILSAISGGIVSFLLPVEFISFATIRAGSDSPSISKMIGGAGALAGFAPLGDLARISGGGSVDFLVALLNTDVIADSVIQKFNLKERYGLKNIESVRAALRKNIVIDDRAQAELIDVGIKMGTPEEAQQATTYYIKQLNNLYTRINRLNAQNNRIHFESRFKEAEKKLQVLEDSLVLFQIRNGLVDIETQFKEAIKATSGLQGAIFEKELELSLKRETLSESSTEVQQLERELRQMNIKFEEMFKGSKTSSSKSGHDGLFIPLNSSQSLGLTYFRLYRQVQIQQEFLKALIPVVEQTKLQEMRESPLLVVVDEPKIPETKIFPSKKLIVLVSMVGGFFASLVYLLFTEHAGNVKRLDPERYEKYRAFLQTFVNDFNPIAWFRK